MAIESGDFVYRPCLEILIYALTNVEELYSYCATRTSWVKPVVTPTPASLQSRFPLQNLPPLQSSPTETLPPPPRILFSNLSSTSAFSLVSPSTIFSPLKSALTTTGGLIQPPPPQLVNSLFSQCIILRPRIKTRKISVLDLVIIK